jgi:hypothetical protein
MLLIMPREKPTRPEVAVKTRILHPLDDNLEHHPRHDPGSAQEGGEYETGAAARRRQRTTREAGTAWGEPVQPFEECDLTVVERAAGAGMSDQQLAVALRCTRATLTLWKRFRKFRQAYQAGNTLAGMIRVVEQALYRSATGYDVAQMEERSKQSTNPITGKAYVTTEQRHTVHHYPPNIEAVKTILFNRAPDEWKMRQGESAGGILKIAGLEGYNIEQMEIARAKIEKQLAEIERTQRGIGGPASIQDLPALGQGSTERDDQSGR